MPTKYRLIMLVAIVLAGLGFSAYGAVLAAPHLDLQRVVSSLNLEAFQTPDASATPEVTESPEATEKPEVSETPDAAESPEATQKPEVSETAEATESPEVAASSVTPSPSSNLNSHEDGQGEDGNSQGTQGGGEGGDHKDGGSSGFQGGGDSLAPWALVGGRY